MVPFCGAFCLLYVVAKSFDYIGTPSLYSGPSMPDCTLEGLVVTGTQAMYAGEIYEVYVKLTAPTPMKIFVSSLYSKL